MIRKAEVINAKGNYATVMCESTNTCSGCNNTACGGSCASKIMISGNAVIEKVRNTVNANVGDLVEIETNESKHLRNMLLSFIIPIIMCATFYGISMHFYVNERFSLILAAAGFVLTILIVAFIEKKLNKKESEIVITKILKTKAER